MSHHPRLAKEREFKGWAHAKKLLSAKDTKVHEGTLQISLVCTRQAVVDHFIDGWAYGVRGAYETEVDVVQPKKPCDCGYF